MSLKFLSASFLAYGSGPSWKKKAEWLSLMLMLISLPISISLFLVTMGAFFMFHLLRTWRSLRLLTIGRLFVFFSIIYFVVNALSVFRSPYPVESIHGLVKVLRGIALCLFVRASLVDDELDWRRAIFVIFVISLVIAADTFFQGFTGVEILRHRAMVGYIEGVDRWTGPFPHPNDLGAYLCLILPLSFAALIAFVKSGKRFQAVFSGAVFVIAAFCLAGTYSRAAWIACAAALFLMCFFLRSRIAISVLAGVLGLTLILSPPSIKFRMTSLWDIKYSTANERVLLWGEAFRMIEKKPWLGFGVNTYAKVAPLFKDEFSLKEGQYAHNGYLQIAAETGIVGLVSFLVLVFLSIFSCLFKAVRSKNEEARLLLLGLTFSLVAFLFHSFCDTNLQSVLLVSYFWVMLGIALAGKTA